MCGEAYCAPFGCIVGKAIEHVGAGNITIGLSAIFAAGFAVGYFVTMWRIKTLSARPQKDSNKENAP